MSGRPRRSGRTRTGVTAREEILEAAAELFTTDGFAATTTRRIAESVGVQQASLYYYFKTKDDILDALLAQTIDAPLQLATVLSARPEPAVVRLYALALADSEQLASARWNLGALYLLPDLRAPRFAAFRQHREELCRHYRELAAGAVGPAVGGGLEQLPFRLVESVIMLRADGEAIASDVLAAATLRVLGVPDDPETVESNARELLARLDAEAER